MPHDANGTELKVGDKVTVEFTVLSILAENEYCNCKLRSVRSMPPYIDSFVELHAVNTQQTVKV